MWTKKHVRAAIGAAGVDATVLRAEDVAATFERLALRYASCSPARQFLWRHFDDERKVYVFDADAWRQIHRFPVPAPRLLVADSQGMCGFLFAGGMSDIEVVLADCPPFEFYLTDDELTFVLAFNFHEAVIGVGRAVPWVLELKAQRDEH